MTRYRTKNPATGEVTYYSRRTIDDLEVEDIECWIQELTAAIRDKDKNKAGEKHAFALGTTFGFTLTAFIVSLVAYL